MYTWCTPMCYVNIHLDFQTYIRRTYAVHFMHCKSMLCVTLVDFIWGIFNAYSMYSTRYIGGDKDTLCHIVEKYSSLHFGVFNTFSTGYIGGSEGLHHYIVAYSIRIRHATLVVRVQDNRIDHWVLFVVKPVCTAIATNIQCTDV